MSYPKLIEELIDHFSQLPGVGRRSAERMVFWFLNGSKDSTQAFASSLMRLKENMRFCRECNHFTENDVCHICSDVRRDASTICVVENPKDLIAIERTGAFKGLYHVLLGALAPSEGRGPEDLHLDHLKERALRLGVKEIVIATDPDTEGEMTAQYIVEFFEDTDIKLSRIGMGLPVGSSVEFVDHSTLMMSMNARRDVKV